VTFFVSLGEQSYNFKTKQKEWCNYDAALFAKDGQIQFYADVLKAGSIVTVTATGLLIESDPTGQYPPKAIMQDAKLGFTHSPAVGMPQQVQQQVQQMAPQQAPQQPPQQQGGYQQQQQPAQAQAPAGYDSLIQDNDVPF
jgi:hypothetical protein